ncbi:KilA-N domain-containing protein [Ottowia thiooxydans]|uniref:KilA-N domain-containing protein n=1 Tax=Ottowia thiooxydans TaxID=219182 RepID=UPI000427397C|nr:KilA-N domain-containing protein [Ottowia thiooxydans]
MATGDKSLTVQGVEIHLTTKGEEDYISLTDMASKFEGADQQIKNWLQNRGTIDFLAVWEQLNNPDFNLVGFHQIRVDAASQRFIMSVKKWTDNTAGIGIIARAGRYGGTFAHKDIAFEFGSWLSPEFKLYLITEFQRFKQAEAERGLDWDVRRTLSKVQYRVHTDAVKEHLIPPQLSSKDAGFVYASEADVLNKALFGVTASEWKRANPDAKGNLRDNATMEQLVVMSSLESQNALLIQQRMPQAQRLQMLNGLARAQLQSLLSNPSLPPLRGGPLLN